uniref:NADH dehydrogenase [ubiquinone] 1 beta subcomplex subunit 11, mitochondrial n=1 Tax=Timema monikensis TaxID=170555 RepID=A0A7R9HQ32_9NEOP|nr:unnamed protein product [Timema monikensis]
MAAACACMAMEVIGHIVMGGLILLWSPGVEQLWAQRGLGGAAEKTCKTTASQVSVMSQQNNSTTAIQSPTVRPRQWQGWEPLRARDELLTQSHKNTFTFPLSPHLRIDGLEEATFEDIRQISVELSPSETVQIFYSLRANATNLMDEKRVDILDLSATKWRELYPKTTKNFISQPKPRTIPYGEMQLYNNNNNKIQPILGEAGRLYAYLRNFISQPKPRTIPSGEMQLYNNNNKIQPILWEAGRLYEFLRYLEEIINIGTFDHYEAKAVEICGVNDYAYDTKMKRNKKFHIDEIKGNEIKLSIKERFRVADFNIVVDTRETVKSTIFFQRDDSNMGKSAYRQRMNQQTAEKLETQTAVKKNWMSYGYDFDNEQNDRNAMHATFIFAYVPDFQLRDWAQREAFLELRRREQLGLPPIDKNLIDPDKIVLPTDEELGDTEIII